MKKVFVFVYICVFASAFSVVFVYIFDLQDVSVVYAGTLGAFAVADYVDRNF